MRVLTKSNQLETTLMIEKAIQCCLFSHFNAAKNVDVNIEEYVKNNWTGKIYLHLPRDLINHALNGIIESAPPH